MISSRSLWKKLTLLGVILSSLALVGCGSDKKNKTTGTQNPFGGNPLFNPSGTGINGIGTTCNGQYRAVNFYTNNPMYENATAIRGTFQEGQLPGNTSKRFFGTNNVGDQIEVRNVTDGAGNVIGFNVILALCDTQQYPLYLNQRPIQMAADARLVLTNNNACANGNVEFAHFPLLLLSANSNVNYNQQPNQYHNYQQTYLNPQQLNVYFSAYCDYGQGFNQQYPYYNYQGGYGGGFDPFGIQY